MQYILFIGSVWQQLLVNVDENTSKVNFIIKKEKKKNRNFNKRFLTNKIAYI